MCQDQNFCIRINRVFQLPRPQAPLRAGKQRARGLMVSSSSRMQQSHNPTRTALKQGVTPGDKAGLPVCWMVRTRPDKHISIDSEDDFRSGTRFTHPEDHIRRTTDNPGLKRLLKPFTIKSIQSNIDINKNSRISTHFP